VGFDRLSLKGVRGERWFFLKKVVEILWNFEC
jgi:hypothetical protein